MASAHVHVGNCGQHYHRLSWGDVWFTKADESTWGIAFQGCKAITRHKCTEHGNFPD